MARAVDYSGRPLSDDERTAITLQARGLTRDEAARKMQVAHGTYVHMLRRVYAKTETPGAAAAVAKLMARGDLHAADIFPDQDGDRPWGGPASDLIHVRIITELDADNLKGLGEAYRALTRRGL